MRFYELKNATIFSVTGKDSLRYLQSRLTADIKRLSIGQSCLAAQLNANGKCQGLFSVFKISDTEFFLASDLGDSNQLLEAFKKYIVADRVTVSSLPDRLEASFFHVLDENHETVASFGKIRPHDRGFAKETQGIDLLITDADKLKLFREYASSKQEIKAAEFDCAAFRRGAPRFSMEITEESLLSETNLVNYVSINKGCYIGQEVIERIESFGKSPKRITRGFINSNQALLAGDEVTLIADDGASKSIGVVLTSTFDVEKARTWLFLRIKNFEQQSTAAPVLHVRGEQITYD